MVMPFEMRGFDINDKQTYYDCIPVMWYLWLIQRKVPLSKVLTLELIFLSVPCLVEFRIIIFCLSSKNDRGILARGGVALYSVQLIAPSFVI